MRALIINHTNMSRFETGGNHDDEAPINNFDETSDGAVHPDVSAVFADFAEIGLAPSPEDLLIAKQEAEADPYR